MVQKVKINFSVNHYSVGFQIVDALYAFYQSQTSDYTSLLDLQITDHIDSSADLNVLGLHMPRPTDIANINVDLYDLIIVNNSCEPLMVATPLMTELLERNNCYILCNSLVTAEHEWAHKIIWWPDNIMECQSYWTRHFYPQYFENLQFRQLPRDKHMTFINGENRSWRALIKDLIVDQCPLISVSSNISNHVHETDDSAFESQQDQDFRVWVNEKYESVMIRNQRALPREVLNGINNKFGSIPLGYYLMPEFFTHDCVIFPETTWQNNELAITEKALKCFHAGSFAWPVGGSNINQMYRDLGFYTAWNLLPKELQEFDQTTDHVTRYQQLIKSIQWLSENPQVFLTTTAQDMLKSNKINLFNANADLLSIKRFDEILRKYYD